MISRGQKIGNYVILDELGRGGYGTVYLAEEVRSGARAAIKFLHPKLFRTEESKEAFINEMINQARLSLNPNIVSVIQSLRFVDAQGEHLGMVMEYVEGEPLDLFIQKYGLLPDFVAVPLFIQVLNGLNLAHQNNILHRDIKPGNIMVGKNGVVKIMDFGLSKAVGGTSGASESARAASLNYTAPERLRRRTVDARTDLYSLGVTMYEALTGKPPYDIEPGDWQAATTTHESGTCPGIRESYPHHNQELERIVRKAMRPSPHDRYQSGQELMADLIGVLQILGMPEKADPLFIATRERAAAIAAMKPRSNGRIPHLARRGMEALSEPAAPEIAVTSDGPGERPIGRPQAFSPSPSRQGTEADAGEGLFGEFGQGRTLKDVVKPLLAGAGIFLLIFMVLSHMIKKETPTPSKESAQPSQQMAGPGRRPEVNPNPASSLASTPADPSPPAVRIESPVRAIGDIKPPKLVRSVEPAYPEIARQARVEGVVIVEVATDVYGRVTSVEILRSIPLLDQAAVDAVRQWVYEPAMINGRPRPIIFTVTVLFRLEEPARSTDQMPQATPPGVPRNEAATGSELPATNGALAREEATPVDDIPEPPAAQVKKGDLVDLSIVTDAPRLVRSVYPAYPPWAKQMGLSGAVTVSALIDEKGDVIDTAILKGVLNDMGLNRAAETAVKKWKFQPATINGVAVKVWKSFVIVFKPAGDSSSP